MRIELGPVTVWEVFERSILIWARHWQILSGTSMAALAAFQALVLAVGGAVGFDAMQNAVAQVSATSLLIVLCAALLMWLLGASSVVVGGLHFDRRVGVSRVCAITASKGRGLVVLGLQLGLAAALVLLPLSISQYFQDHPRLQMQLSLGHPIIYAFYFLVGSGTLYAGLRLLFVGHAMLSEGCTTAESLVRGWDISAGYSVKMLVLLVLSGGLSTVLALLTRSLWSQWFSQAVVDCLSVPLYAFYYSLPLVVISETYFSVMLRRTDMTRPMFVDALPPQDFSRDREYAPGSDGEAPRPLISLKMKPIGGAAVAEGRLQRFLDSYLGKGEEFMSQDEGNEAGGVSRADKLRALRERVSGGRKPHPTEASGVSFDAAIEPIEAELIMPVDAHQTAPTEADKRKPLLAEMVIAELLAEEPVVPVAAAPVVEEPTMPPPLAEPVAQEPAELPVAVVEEVPPPAQEELPPQPVVQAEEPALLIVEAPSMQVASLELGLESEEPSFMPIVELPLLQAEEPMPPHPLAPTEPPPPVEVPAPPLDELEEEIRGLLASGALRDDADAATQPQAADFDFIWDDAPSPLADPDLCVVEEAPQETPLEPTPTVEESVVLEAPTVEEEMVVPVAEETPQPPVVEAVPPPQELPVLEEAPPLEEPHVVAETSLVEEPPVVEVTLLEAPPIVEDEIRIQSSPSLGGGDHLAARENSLAHWSKPVAATVPAWREALASTQQYLAARLSK